jgi:8-oxo-dGTP pyrophosphatase MutT (NUDIX family)
MPVEIIRLRGLESRFVPAPWPFAEENGPEIEQHWAALIAQNPALWNGTVLLQHTWDLSDGLYCGSYMPVSYASFLAWRTLGNPAPAVRNGFSMAALQSADGAYILGVMASHTANPGKIYFAAGTPDPDDVTADGKVNLAGSLRRELFEETGLTPDEVTFGDEWTLALDGWRAAFLQPARIDLPAEEAQRLIRGRLPHVKHPELADVVVVRSLDDIDAARMPGFCTAFLAHALATAA